LKTRKTQVTNFADVDVFAAGGLRRESRRDFTPHPTTPRPGFFLAQNLESILFICVPLSRLNHASFPTMEIAARYYRL
jgi:hypothetical protein